MKATARPVEGKAVNWKATGKQRDENKTGALGHPSENRSLRKRERNRQQQKRIEKRDMRNSKAK